MRKVKERIVYYPIEGKPVELGEIFNRNNGRAPYIIFNGHNSLDTLFAEADEEERITIGSETDNHDDGDNSNNKINMDMMEVGEFKTYIRDEVPEVYPNKEQFRKRISPI